MRDKIDLLLKTKRLSATSFARMLEIQPSSISHILSGRNKPSYDLVVKILRAFPELNPDWLLLDSSEMFRDKSEHSSDSTLFPTAESDLQTGAIGSMEENMKISESKTEEKNELVNIFSRTQNGQKDVDRILILYRDGSFDSYSK